MAAGTIVEWKDQGFGFIKPDTPDAGGRGKDLFFHVQSWLGARPPAKDGRVEFQVRHVEGRGLQAVQVSPEIDGQQASDEMADVLTEAEFWGEVGPSLRGVLAGVARRHGWVE